MKRAFAKVSAVAVALLLATTAALASEQGHFQKTLQVSGGANLEVLTRSGDVVVHSGPAGSIAISEGVMP